MNRMFMGSSTFIGIFVDYEIEKITETMDDGSVSIVYCATNIANKDFFIYNKSFEGILASVIELQRDTVALYNFEHRLEFEQ